MEKVLRKAAEFGFSSPTLEKPLHRLQQMPGASKLLGRLASASQKEDFLDYLAELRYALIFAGLGFEVEIDPLGSAGPDLRISRNDHESVVEVTRFRKMYPGPPKLGSDSHGFLLEKYGDTERYVRKSDEKISGKFTQVQAEDAVIALWNDDGDMEELEVEQAVSGLLNDANQGVVSIPAGIAFVLYASDRVWFPGGVQFWCSPLQDSQKRHHITWQRELAAASVDKLIKCALAQTMDTG